MYAKNIFFQRSTPLLLDSLEEIISVQFVVKKGFGFVSLQQVAVVASVAGQTAPMQLVTPRVVNMAVRMAMTV